MASTTETGPDGSSKLIAARSARAKRTRLPGLPPEWENFDLCMMFHLPLPLLPLGVEYVASGKITGPSVTMASGMYVIGVGTSSRSTLQFGLRFVLCILNSVAYGLLIAKPGADSTAIYWSSAGLILIFVMHALERYNRHVVDLDPYWEFIKN
jgi:hypothetical protein